MGITTWIYRARDLGACTLKQESPPVARVRGVLFRLESPLTVPVAAAGRPGAVAAAPLSSAN